MSDLVAPAAHPAFHVMAKPTGAVCNLDCEYCYFLSKELLYPGSGFRMTPEVHETYVRQLLAAHEGSPEVVVAFQGGEPTLMGLDFFRRTLELEQQYRRPGQTVLNTVQTNGTLLDDEWGAFLREHDFLVGVSMDGPRDMHDAFRVDKGGKPTFDRVVRGIDVLRRHGVDWNALVTVNAANGDHGREVYTFLRDELSARFIQLIPVVERATSELLPLAEEGWGRRGGERPLYRQRGDQVTHRTVGAEQYGRFLVEVFEEWVRHDVGDVFVQEFDTALAHWLGLDQATDRDIRDSSAGDDAPWATSRETGGSVCSTQGGSMAKQEKDVLYVIAATYDDVDQAVADYEAIKALYREVRTSHDFDASVIAKDADGKVHIVKKHEQPTRHGAAVGLGWGLAVGVVAALFPPVGIGIVAGGAGGAAIGAVTGHAVGGMSRDDLKELGDTLDAGQAGLVAVYETNLADQVAATIKAANRVVSKATDMAADELAADMKKAEEESARIPEQATASSTESAEKTAT